MVQEEKQVAYVYDEAMNKALAKAQATYDETWASLKEAYKQAISQARATRDKARSDAEKRFAGEVKGAWDAWRKGA